MAVSAGQALPSVRVDVVARLKCGRVDAAASRCRRVRLWLVLAAALLWSGVVVWRLFSLQISDCGYWQNWALRQHSTEITVASERGPIYDRNHNLLATSVPAGSLYVRPAKLTDPAGAARQLSKLLNIPEAELRSKFASRQPFVWIRRQIPKAAAEQAAALRLPGVEYMLESRRYYPYNAVASNLVGKVGVDGNGLSGIEAAYQSRLRGESVSLRVAKDALGNQIQGAPQGGERLGLPQGRPLTLTIDAGIQTIVSRELESGRVSARAKAAMAVVIDADSGEILAMAQAPALNFNYAKIESKQDLSNRVVEAVFEPGSIMKPIVAAAAIEMGLMTPQDVLDCEGGRYTFAGHTIKDVHPYGRLTLADVVVRSSNIGMTKVGRRLGAERLYQSLRAFGFGQGGSLNLPGETGGILRGRESWAEIDVATHAFGQGVAVTPLQMVRAVAAISNGGLLPTLRVVADEREYPVTRVISEATAEKVREMMYRVVEDQHGTGNKALLAGVRIGGKTGTAQKAREDGRGYAGGLYVASFVGFVDGKVLGVPRKLASIVVIDEPHSGTIYGGTLAAPVFNRIMHRTLHLLATNGELKGQTPSRRELGPREDGVIMASFRP
jgi:cell division protein FtsI (penicillin-binding protein 3)